LRFLEQHLPVDLGRGAKQVEVLHGTLSDMEQQRIVEDFGREEAPVRLLLASNVASDGINLHFLCHRMIHFDIPWSISSGSSPAGSPNGSFSTAMRKN